MLTLSRTHALTAKPEREIVSRYAQLSDSQADAMFDQFKAIPKTEPETLSQQLYRETMERKSAQRAAQDLEFAEHDWNTSPANWKPEAVLYYLEFVCSENVSHESKTGTDSITAENLSRAFFQFRQRNTETACATVPRAELLNAVKNAKKLNPKSPAKTVSLRINGCLDVVTSDHTARFSQAVRYDSKAGDLRLTFPEQRLTAICSKLKSTTVELVLSSCEQLNEHVLTVKTESAEFTIPVELPTDSDKFASDFPAQFAHNVTAGELLRAFKMTEFATDTESTRYALAGCFLQPGEDTLNIAATDSRRLSVETIQAEVLGAIPELESGKTHAVCGVTIPHGIVALMMDELKRQPEKSVVSFAIANVITRRKELVAPEELSAKAKSNWQPSTIGFVCLSDGITTTNVFDGEKYWQEDTRQEFVFELPDVFSIRGVPVQGRFPRYMDVIPRNFESAYVLDRKELLNACETIILSTDEESRGVDFVFPDESEPLRISLNAKAERMGTATTKAPCVSVKSDKRHTVTLDPDYTIDYLKRSDAESILIQIQDSETAVVMTENEHTYRTLRNGSGVYVQMPLSQDR